MTSAVKALRGAGQRLEGRRGPHPGRVPSCHPGPDAGLDRGGCTQWATAQVQWVERSHEVLPHSPQAEVPTPAPLETSTVTERTQHQDGDTPPCWAPLSVSLQTLLVEDLKPECTGQVAASSSPWCWLWAPARLNIAQQGFWRSSCHLWGVSASTHHPQLGRCELQGAGRDHPGTCDHSLSPPLPSPVDTGLRAAWQPWDVHSGVRKWERGTKNRVPIALDTDNAGEKTMS